MPRFLLSTAGDREYHNVSAVEEERLSCSWSIRFLFFPPGISYLWRIAVSFCFPFVGEEEEVVFIFYLFSRFSPGSSLSCCAIYHIPWSPRTGETRNVRISSSGREPPCRLLAALFFFLSLDLPLCHIILRTALPRYLPDLSILLPSCSRVLCFPRPKTPG